MKAIKLLLVPYNTDSCITLGNVRAIIKNMTTHYYYNINRWKAYTAQQQYVQNMKANKAIA